MRLTNRQRCLRDLLRAGWRLMEGVPVSPGAGPRFYLTHDLLKRIPPGFDWVDYQTVNGLYKRGLLTQAPGGWAYKEVSCS